MKIVTSGKRSFSHFQHSFFRKRRPKGTAHDKMNLLAERRNKAWTLKN
ncbi:hypothetical protein HOLDEFILI_02736 [Holdemania filiformis DSM 12042]|uniref:Uncharacterized protein n=1 Tax=Holdemania filiformis DSM 12042 TaxID=545696 RepID=B9YA79_9FIRM|nr:hypothetical protein HOLDEFILI_02736 [Holdemania filiformis DSM 12042]